MYIDTEEYDWLRTRAAKADELERANVMRDAALEAGPPCGPLTEAECEELAQGILGVVDCDGCEEGKRYHREQAHSPTCRVGAWLRRLRGPEETQRQVDIAHAEAIEIENMRQMRRFDVTSQDFVFRDVVAPTNALLRQMRELGGVASGASGAANSARLIAIGAVSRTSEPGILRIQRPLELRHRHRRDATVYSTGLIRAALLDDTEVTVG